MIPRRIFILWLQGEKSAPPIVQMCILRWRRLNPDWDVVVLDRSDVQRILADFPVPIGRMQPQALSDVLRVRLLSDQGGVWVDATTFPTAPLDDWLPEAAHSGFFAFEGHRKPLDVDSWFLAAAPGHVIPRLWWDEIERYWSTERSLIIFRTGHFWNVNYNFDPLSFFTDDTDTSDLYPYYWVMYIFTFLLHTNPEFRSAWAKVNTVSSHAAHAIHHLSVRSPDVSDEQLIAASAGTPVQKLSFKDGNSRRWQRLDRAFSESDRSRSVSFDAFPVFEADETEPSALSRTRAAAETWARGVGGDILRRVGARR